MKELHFADLGMKCDFSAKANTLEEILKIATKHAKDIHHMPRLDERTLQEAMTLVRDVGA